LEKVVGSLPSRWSPWPGNVTVLPPENKAFSELGEGLLAEARNGLIPLFAFVDPFGYKDAPIDLIRRLLQYNKAELFIYFDFNSVNRFAGKHAGVDHRFEALFGCDDFYNAPARGPARQKFLHDLYERQLRTVCSMAYVRSFEMVNETGPRRELPVLLHPEPTGVRPDEACDVEACPGRGPVRGPAGGAEGALHR
jgi:hypothetical protein